jgi:hypothetical protein
MIETNVRGAWKTDGGVTVHLRNGEFRTFPDVQVGAGRDIAALFFSVAGDFLVENRPGLIAIQKISTGKLLFKGSTRFGLNVEWEFAGISGVGVYFISTNIQTWKLVNWEKFSELELRSHSFDWAMPEYFLCRSQVKSETF